MEDRIKMLEKALQRLLLACHQFIQVPWNQTGGRVWPADKKSIANAMDFADRALKGDAQTKKDT